MTVARLIKKAEKYLDPDKMKAVAKNYDDKRQVYVGVQRDAKAQPDGTPMVVVAAAHEFGAPNAGIPERPYLRNTIRQNVPLYRVLNRRNLKAISQGSMTMDQALGQLGEMAKGHVQKFIASNPYVISEKTAKRKGSTRALIDKGNLRQSIQWVIE